MPAVIGRQPNGQLDVIIQGATGNPNLLLKPEAEVQLNDSVRINAVPQPLNQTNTEVHVNVHTGHAIWQWWNHSLLLNPDGFSRNFPHLGASFVDFVLANIPQNIRQNLPALPGGQNFQPAHFLPMRRNATLAAMPTEILQNIGSKLHARDLKALTRVDKPFRNTFQYNLDAIHTMIHAGKSVVSGQNGQQLIGEGGDKLRENPVVRGQNLRPLMDGNGNSIHRPAEFNEVYFQTRDNARPPVLDAAGGILRDHQGRVVRQPPTFNAAFYEDALMHIERGVKRPYQQAALNALKAAMEENPVPEYTLVIDLQNGTATIPVKLAAALQSPRSKIRNWALERIANDYYDQNVLPQNHPMANAVRVALDLQLLALPGFVDTVNVRQGLTRQIATVALGRSHKTMYYSPNGNVRDLGRGMSTRIADRIRATQRIQIAPIDIDRDNDPYNFPVLRNRQGGVTAIDIPVHYNSWIRSQPSDSQRINLNRLLSLARTQHGTLNGAIASGIGTYLVRNIADWPSHLVEKLLLSHTVLYGQANFFASERRAFFAALSQPGHRGQIPPHLVAEVGNRMLIIGRNQWAQQQCDLLTGNWGASVEFANWASRQKVDLPMIAFASPAVQQQYINDFAGNDAGRQVIARNLLNWLAQNGMNAPQQ